MKKKRNRIGYLLKLTKKQQKDLAEAIGCTPMAVSFWASGRQNPYHGYMDDILAFFNTYRPKNHPPFTEDDVIYFG